MRVRARGVGEGARIPADYAEGVRLDAYRVAYHKRRRRVMAWRGLLWTAAGMAAGVWITYLLGLWSRFWL